jgi:hypothetical protein
MRIGCSFPVSKGVFRTLKQVSNLIKSEKVDKLTKFLNYVLLKSRFYCMSYSRETEGNSEKNYIG